MTLSRPWPLLLLLLLLLLCMGQPASLWAQTAPSRAEIEQLQKDMYRYYSTHQTAEFFDATEKLKTACLKAGDERLFYRAWGNQAIYTCLYIGREKAMDISKEIREYALQRDSKYGLYTATYVSGNILSNMGQIDRATASFLEAADYLHRYFPKESAAAIYISLADLHQNRGLYETALEYAHKALDEPNISKIHQLAAHSDICINYGLSDRKEDFLKAYADRKKVIDEYGHDDYKGSIVETFRALFSGQYDEALQQAKNIKGEITRRRIISAINEKKGDYAEALKWFRAYKQTIDSMNTVELRGRSEEYANQLNLARAENEAKDLRLANQNLRLIQVSNELEQQRLEAEAAALKLENTDIELAHAAVKLKNDSLQSETKDLKIREYQSEMRAQEQAAAARKTREWLVGVIVAIVLASLAIILYRRRQQMQRLEEANTQLAKARHEAEQALLVKRHFLNNISHEMRTPLNAISGFSEILAMPDMELSQEERNHLGGIISENTTLLTGIIEKMIELSFYDSKTHLNKEDTVHVNEMCRRLTDDFREKAASGVSLKFQSDLPDAHVVTTNQLSLKRMMEHVMDNAVKYTSAGHITLSVTDSERRGMLTFAIADTGVGIPPERQQQVFELFIETGEDVKTTGIGLSISRSIIELLGGDISIDPSYTEGCRVVFHLPNIY